MSDGIIEELRALVEAAKGERYDWVTGAPNTMALSEAARDAVPLLLQRYDERGERVTELENENRELRGTIDYVREEVCRMLTLEEGIGER